MKIKASIGASDLRADAILVGVFSGEEKKAGDGVSAGAVKKFLASLGKESYVSGKSNKLFFSFIPEMPGKGLFAAGLGERKKFSANVLRRLGAELFHRASELGFSSVRLELDTLAAGDVKLPDAAAAIAEGVRLKEYRFDRYKTKPKDEKPDSLKEIVLAVRKSGALAAVEKEIDTTEEILLAANFTRKLGDEPANVMTPRRLAEEARKMARQTGLRAQILDEKEIRRLKMGGLLSVAQGSKEPPRFIILEHRGRGGKPIVFVGKGICFDSGGISLKPAAGMDLMRFDMCGGAAVIGALQAVSLLKLKHHVISLVPTCENMPSETPQRPGDIHTTMSGKTVEVVNTDAEGRLILSDALAYAQRYKPRAIIDLATLTGACVATFADKAIGMMGNNAALLKAVQDAGEKTGERCWQLPLWEEYGEMIKSNVADLQNIGGKYAGTITAGKFLEAFVGDFPWVHLDIAGVAWRESPVYYAKAGATGAGVRLLLRYLRDLKA